MEHSFALEGFGLITVRIDATHLFNCKNSHYTVNIYYISGVRNFNVEIYLLSAKWYVEKAEAGSIFPLGMLAHRGDA